MSTDPRIRQAPWFRAKETKRLMAALGREHARFVGGIVRDTLLNRLPDMSYGGGFGDVDVATIHEPNQTIKLTEAAGLKAVDTGKEHGTITVVVDHIPFEVTTLRRDVATDGRRAVVSFTNDWKEDALRRDFTFNALFADVNGTIHDETGLGLQDLESKFVRFIGDAETRIREDYLRILRFFRFGAMLGDAAQLDEGALATCARLKDGIDTLSSERLSMEMLKLLALGNPFHACVKMKETGVLDKVLPGATCSDWFESLSQSTNSDPLARLYALGGSRERLRLSNAHLAMLQIFDEGEVFGLAPDKQAVLTALYKFGRESATRLLSAYVHHPGSMVHDDGSQVQVLVQSLDVPVFPLKGKDLLDCGAKPGPEIGRVLKEREALWIESGYQMSKEELLSVE